MSVTAVQDSAKELRRLAIAGSGLAKGDFRIKKIIPELQKTGATVPVFAKVASSLEELTAAKDAATAQALLQAATLVNAILYTQVASGVQGSLAPIETYSVPFHSKPTAAKVLRSVIEALSKTGAGRLEAVKNAHASGAFEDLRLLLPAVRGLADPYPEVADFLLKKVLPQYGKAVLPLVRADFDPKGGAADQRRLRFIAQSMEPAERRAFCLDLLENGSKEIRVAAIQGIESDPECLSTIVNHLKDRSMEVREAAYNALAHQDSALSLDKLFDAIETKDSDLAVQPLSKRMDKKGAERLIAIADKLLAKLFKADKDARVQIFINVLKVLAGDKSGTGVAYFIQLFKQHKKIAAVKSAAKTDLTGKDIVHKLQRRLAESGDERAADALIAELDLKEPAFCFEACIRSKSPKFVYDTFHPILSSDKHPKKLRDEFIEEFVRLRGFGHLGYYYWHPADPGDEVVEPAFIKEWDDRWLDQAHKRGENWLVCSLLKPGDKKNGAYVADLAKNSTKPQEVVSAMQALSGTGYKDWMSLLQHRLRETKPPAKSAGYMADLLQVFMYSFPYGKLSDEDLGQLDTMDLKLAEKYEEILRGQVSQEKHRRASAGKV